jgi:glycosyltransferase involved in cell wall biosynthesis
MRTRPAVSPFDPARDPAGSRVLVVAPTPYFADRGCHVRIYEEARTLQARGVDVLVVTYPLGRTLAGVPTSRTIAVPWYRKLEAGPSVHKVYIDGLLLARTIREIRRFRPDVVHAHLHEGAAIALAARAVTRVPFVFDIQGSLADELAAHGAASARGGLYRFARGIERFLYARADALVVNSAAAAGFLAGEFGVAPRRVTVAPDAVAPRPAGAEDARDLRRRLDLGDGAVIGFLGLMTAYQGMDLLLDALPRVIEKRPDVRALLMGFPNERYRRRAEVEGLSGSVRFTGRVPYEEVTRHLAAVTVAVSPKVTSSEGNGKLLDYMAAGLPTVAFDTPVNREILGTDGLLVAEQNATALAEGLIRALDGPDGRGERLRRRAAELFSWDRSVGALLGAYDRAVTGRA